MKSSESFIFYIVFIILLFLAERAKSDTIDYYHVYYNNVKIKEYPNDTIPIIIKKSEIKDSDTLSIRYWNDTPCTNCKFYLVVIDNKKIYVKVTSTTGQGTPLSISMKDILEWSAINLVDNFDIYYYEEKPAYPIHLFKLIFK